MPEKGVYLEVPMKRSLWIVAFLVVVVGFAGFQQYQSWSLNKPQSSAQTTSEGSGSGDSGQGRSTGGQAQGRAGGRAGVKPFLFWLPPQFKGIVPIQIRAVGNVEAYTTVSIKSQVTGVINKAHFKEGQDVKKDQLLFTIDPRPFDAALKQAEANLARDNAQLKNLREQVRRYAELVGKAVCLPRAIRSNQDQRGCRRVSRRRG